MEIRRSADHEQAAAFGPCQSGESFFCQGSGTERMDPADPFSAGTVITCYPCFSHAEAKIIQENVLSVLGERAA